MKIKYLRITCPILLPDNSDVTTADHPVILGIPASHRPFGRSAAITTNAAIRCPSSRPAPTTTSAATHPANCPSTNNHTSEYSYKWKRSEHTKCTTSTWRPCSQYLHSTISHTSKRSHRWKHSNFTTPDC